MDLLSHKMNCHQNKNVYRLRLHSNDVHRSYVHTSSFAYNHNWQRMLSSINSLSICLSKERKKNKKKEKHSHEPMLNCDFNKSKLHLIWQLQKPSIPKSIIFLVCLSCDYELRNEQILFAPIPYRMSVCFSLCMTLIRLRIVSTYSAHKNFTLLYMYIHRTILYGKFIRCKCQSRTNRHTYIDGYVNIVECWW